MSVVIFPMKGDDRRKLWRKAFGTFILPLRNPSVRVLRMPDGSIAKNSKGDDLRGYWVDLTHFSSQTIQNVALVMAMAGKLEYDAVMNVFETTGFMVRANNTIVVSSENPLFELPV